MFYSRKITQVAVAAVAVFFAGAAMAPAEEPLAVTYRAADVVYLNAGREDGLRVGEGLTTTAGWLEVTHLASHSAACRVIAESLPVRAGDAVDRHLVHPASLAMAGVRALPALAIGEPVAGAVTRPYPVEPWVTGVSRLRAVELEGSVSLDWEFFQADSGSGRDFERRVARIDLRARGLGGEGHELRLRMSGYQYESSSRNRIYEAAFVRRPEDGNMSFSLGRLAGGPRVGYGSLDGLLGAWQLNPALSMGGFYGSPAELDSWAINSDDRRYGLFAEYLTAHAAGSRAVDLRLAGIREEIAGETSRDYLSFEGQMASRDGRWWFRHRAELDVNSGWRYEASGRQYQLSNLSLGLARRFGGGQRLSLSYDRFQLYRTDATRWLDGALFDDRPRHALRASLLLGRARGWRSTLSAAVRSREGDPDRSYSYSASARSPLITPWRLALSGNVLYFYNPLTEGYTAHLRASRSFDRGRRLYLDLGRREWQPHLVEVSQSAQWLRLGGDLQLRRDLSLRSEYELSSGDALAGQRALVGLRYRLRGNR